MINKVLRIFKKEYRTLNTIEVSKENLLHNYRYLSSLQKKVKIAPVLKSNAYGHGLIEIAKILDPLKAAYFCVDSLFEAYELLKIRIKTPILIMGNTDPENFKVKKLPFSFAVFDLDVAKILNEYQSGCSVHIFVDTGMNREGVKMTDLPNFLENLKLLPNLRIEGLMSHFACADNSKDPLNKFQIKNFKKTLAISKKYEIKPKWIHLQNSDGLASHIGSGKLNLARVGLSLYGISSDPNLKPILALKSKIIQIKRLNKGDRVGYGATFIAKKDTILGVLPLGYYDGVDRRLSNHGWVTILGIPCKIIGRVSMNITTIDLTRIPNPSIGQEVFIYSSNPSDLNSISNAAKLCQTIPYDILIGLSASTKRVII